MSKRPPSTTWFVPVTNGAFAEQGKRITSSRLPTERKALPLEHYIGGWLFSFIESVVMASFLHV